MRRTLGLKGGLALGFLFASALVNATDPPQQRWKKASEQWCLKSDINEVCMPRGLEILSMTDSSVRLSPPRNTSSAMLLITVLTTGERTDEFIGSFENMPGNDSARLAVEGLEINIYSEHPSLHVAVTRLSKDIGLSVAAESFEEAQQKVSMLVADWLAVDEELEATPEARLEPPCDEYFRPECIE